MKTWKLCFCNFLVEYKKYQRKRRTDSGGTCTNVRRNVVECDDHTLQKPDLHWIGAHVSMWVCVHLTFSTCFRWTAPNLSRLQEKTMNNLVWINTNKGKNVVWINFFKSRKYIIKILQKNLSLNVILIRNSTKWTYMLGSWSVMETYEIKTL